MMEAKSISLQLFLFLLLCSTIQIRASDPIFYESFDESFKGRWILSNKADYTGVWKHSASEGHQDFGLLVSEKAKKYAIVKELEKPVGLNDGTVVLQFEVRLQNGLECGGAYLKFLRPQGAGWTPSDFDNQSPYSVMFGPDKCGSTNKIHFIYNHKIPVSGEYVEHHLKNPPSVPYDKLTHVYTAVVSPSGALRLLLDGDEKKKASFLSAEDFEPPLIPPAAIPDPDDRRPDDWDERAKIPDPAAVKPDDWDEEAPMEISDEEASKPEGWLDDEPEEVDDPDAAKPEDWDEEEDGEWEAPKIDNPKCEAAPGCGEWKRPGKRNPAYKGKWKPEMVDNPAYKGVWEPRRIPNPDHFDLDRPDFEPISAVGIEIWTMQDGILFDNILIADEETAGFYRKTTWRPKFDKEKEKKRAEEAAAAAESARGGGGAGGLSAIHKRVFDALYKIPSLPFLEAYSLKIYDAIQKAEKQPNLTVGGLVAAMVVLLTVVLKAVFGGKKKKKAVAGGGGKREGEVEASAGEAYEKGGEEEKEEGGKQEGSTTTAPNPARRRVKRDT